MAESSLVAESGHGSAGKTTHIDVWRIAWRNLWRSKRRTWLTSGGIAFAIWMLVFSISAQNGTFSLMIDNGARLFSGHIQLQHPDYLDDPRLEHSLRNVGALMRRVAENPEVLFASARAQSFALTSVGERSFGAQILGVEAEKELAWSTLPGMQREGRYLQGPGEAFIGSVLARNLGISIGEELVMLGTSRQGGVAAHVAQVVGTFTTGQAEIDRSVVQIPLDDFRAGWELSPDEAHTIIVIADDVGTSAALARKLGGPGWVSLDWTELMPEAEQMIEMKYVGVQLFFAVITVIVTFSVVNTFMMMVFERTPEFGMLMAIGMRPGAIVRELMVEAFWLCLLGVLLGAGISFLMIALLGEVGIPLPVDAAELIASYNIPDRIYPAFDLQSVLTGAAVMFVGTQLAALVPAWRICHMKPVDAIRARE
jgi:putative ABC transport system permease protein